MFVYHTWTGHSRALNSELAVDEIVVDTETK